MDATDLSRRCADLERHVDVLRATLLEHGVIPPALEQTVSALGPPDDGGLSARELDVVALVAEGLPNAVIAQRLYVGVDTVKTHLQRAYRKLDVHSRAGAAVWYVTTHGAVPTTDGDDTPEGPADVRRTGTR